MRFSAGNTRGLIEAVCCAGYAIMGFTGFPRGIPAASLKHEKRS